MRKFFYYLIYATTCMASESPQPFLDLYVNHLASNHAPHTDEVRSLYKEYAQEFCQNLLQENPSNMQEKKIWMVKFFTLNPLSPAMLQYGLEEIPSSFEILYQEYNRLSSEPISYHKLNSKLVCGLGFRIGSGKSIGRTGCFFPPSYLYALEGLNIDYETKLESLENGYLYRKKMLVSSYASRLSGRHSPLMLQFLNDQFTYELDRLRNPYRAQLEKLKTNYRENLQNLKRQFYETEHSLNEDMELNAHFEAAVERICKEVQTTFIEEDNQADRYEEARALLEKVKKEFN